MTACRAYFVSSRDLCHLLWAKICNFASSRGTMSSPLGAVGLNVKFQGSDDGRSLQLTSKRQRSLEASVAKTQLPGLNQG